MSETDRAALEYAVAQLRHAYHNLIGPDRLWDREQRMRFADGLIGPQIVRIEKALASSDQTPALRALVEHPPLVTPPTTRRDGNHA
jgi:hypothetical protein